MGKSSISNLQYPDEIVWTRSLDLSFKNRAAGLVKKGDVSSRDLITNLPDSIIEGILIQLPIIDAIKTSILSRQWKNKWHSISHLVFDKKCVPNGHDRDDLQERVVKFISKVLFLHQGPVHKFQITHWFLQSCPKIDQWILFLSRNDIKDLTFQLRSSGFSRMPSSLFSCQKLTRLKLSCCELKLPHSFKGFPCLKSLYLHCVLISRQAIESLISSSPLLENFSFHHRSCMVLTVRAPNLKYLFLQGEFKDIFLVDMPLLVELSVCMYMPDNHAGYFEQSSNCNIVKFLGGIPNILRLYGFMHFTKYLSIGHHGLEDLTMYNNLESIQMDSKFNDMKEIRVILRLITSAPNLKILYISGSSSIEDSKYTKDLDFWENECPSDNILSKLKVVSFEMNGMLREFKFIKFLLGCSPILETMSIIPLMSSAIYQMTILVKLLKFRRASSKAEISFIRN